EVGLRRHRHVDRLGDTTNERLIITHAKASGSGTTIGNVEHLEQRRHVHFHKRVIVKTFVAKIQDKMRAVCTKFGIERGMVVQKAKEITSHPRQRSFNPSDLLEIPPVPAPIALDRVGKARIAENARYVRKERGSA